MAIFLNFCVGFVASIIGVIPPGLLNMYAAKISMKEGRRNAILFSLGVCITVMAQTFVALLFARYIEMHPEIVSMLQKVALGIFICLTIYFFFIAKDTRREVPDKMHHSKTNRFFSGMLIGALNLLPLPYWVYISLTFSDFGWFTFSHWGIAICVLASALGTFAMLAIYVQFFRPKDEPKKMNVNMNYIIGAITLLICVVTFIRILNTM